MKVLVLCRVQRASSKQIRRPALPNVHGRMPCPLVQDHRGMLLHIIGKKMTKEGGPRIENISLEVLRRTSLGEALENSSSLSRFNLHSIDALHDPRPNVQLIGPESPSVSNVRQLDSLYDPRLNIQQIDSFYDPRFNIQPIAEPNQFIEC